MAETIVRSIIVIMAALALIGFVKNVKKSDPGKISEGSISETDILGMAFLVLAFLFWVTGLK
jgi:hypothetical protein